MRRERENKEKKMKPDKRNVTFEVQKGRKGKRILKKCILFIITLGVFFISRCRLSTPRSLWEYA